MKTEFPYVKLLKVQKTVISLKFSSLPLAKYPAVRMTRCGKDERTLRGSLWLVWGHISVNVTVRFSYDAKLLYMQSVV